MFSLLFSCFLWQFSEMDNICKPHSGFDSMIRQSFNLLNTLLGKLIALQFKSICSFDWTQGIIGLGSSARLLTSLPLSSTCSSLPTDGGSCPGYAAMCLQRRRRLQASKHSCNWKHQILNCGFANVSRKAVCLYLPALRWTGDLSGMGSRPPAALHKITLLKV